MTRLLCFCQMEYMYQLFSLDLFSAPGGWSKEGLDGFRAKPESISRLPMISLALHECHLPRVQRVQAVCHPLLSEEG